MKLGLVTKELFFDTKRVERGMDAATKSALTRFGAFVRQRAKTSIRRAPKGQKARVTGIKAGRFEARYRKGLLSGVISAPGKPPLSHEGSLRRLIYFGYDRDRRSVVAGPTPFRRGDAPALLEYGGQVTRTIVRKSKRTGRMTRRTMRMTYRPRPFMGPAFLAELPNAPAGYAGAFK